MAYNLWLKRCAHNRKMHLILHGTATWAATRQHRQQLQIVDTRHEVTRGRKRRDVSDSVGGCWIPRLRLRSNTGLVYCQLVYSRLELPPRHPSTRTRYTCDDGAVKWTSDDHTHVMTPSTIYESKVWINHLKMLRHILSQRSLAISQLLAATSVPLLGTLTNLE